MRTSVFFLLCITPHYIYAKMPEKNDTKCLKSVQIILSSEDMKVRNDILIKLKNYDFKLSDTDAIPYILFGQIPCGEVIQSDQNIHSVKYSLKSHEELDVNAASMKLKSIETITNNGVSNWWDAGFTGAGAVLGILDSGVPDNYVDEKGREYFRHPGLKEKNMMVNRTPTSGFGKYLNGVRTAHGTGVACIYASNLGTYQGVSFGASDVLVALAGDSEVDDTDWSLTLQNLNWMFNGEVLKKPTTINYSFGNGDIHDEIDDWSDISKVVDYIINEYDVTWVKSAGNKGWIDKSDAYPYASTMSVPADSYNSIVVANMNTTLSKTDHSLTKTADRTQHVITASSSRGPTLSGRKKPDLTSPGNDTRTCAPDPSIYAVAENPTFHPYGISMQYHQDSQTRLAGGTSMATPHVGGASALLYSAGIHAPAAIKSLLINSADTWTDNDQPGPGDIQHPCDSSLPMCGHGQKAGSQWNRTYGWGYINMDNAYQQKDNVIKLDVFPNNPICFQGESRLGSKSTVVWNRRFGFTNNKLWSFTPINMMLFSAERKILLDEDLSRIDNVIQVSNYPREKGKYDYFNESVILKVYIPNDVVNIDGSDSETAYLTSEKNLTLVDCPDWIYFGRIGP